MTDYVRGVAYDPNRGSVYDPWADHRSPCERDGHNYDRLDYDICFYFCKRCADLKNVARMVRDSYEESA